MKELELKDIAGYLPYGLKAMWTKENDISDFSYYGKKISITPLTCNFPLDYEHCKIILRPMSDLYKPCLEDGKIPIVELFKFLCTKEEPFESFKTRLMIDYLEVDSDAMFYYEDKAFRYVVDDKIEGFIPCQLELFQKLYEWHFDIHGLIEQGKAIDINTTQL